MKRRRFEGFWIAALFFAIPAAAVLLDQGPQATADDEPQGRIVDITDGNSDQPQAENEDPAAEGQQQPAEQAVPKYWIGLQGRPIDSPVLRTQFQLAEDVGVVVENVVPDSPADKAGLRQHDIIVAVNGEPVTGMQALQEVVASSEAQAIELKVIRLAKESSVKVTPEERPKDLPQGLLAQPEGNPLGAAGPQELEQFFRQLQQGNVPGGVRVFGPGMVLGGQAFNLNQMPEGISVSVTRQGKEPPTITVQKGDQTWTVKGDDPQALKQLPEDVRPFVQKMLAGSKPGPAGLPRFDFDLEGVLPEEMGQFDAGGAGKRVQEANKRLREQIEQLEQRMRQLEEQMQAPADEPAEAEDPSKT
ncbi:MAG: hypothetical protein DCC67_06145 [Planctomycetota bacterium]|nr:MAG: hypothetical protein DCC67_06145 [Planctomycetota bacterium]